MVNLVLVEGIIEFSLKFKGFSYSHQFWGVISEAETQIDDRKPSH